VSRGLRLGVALMMPIIALSVMAGLRHYQQSSGQEVILPVQGYDPRDLLSGHYLRYSVDYGVEESCTYSQTEPAVICLQPESAFRLGTEAPQDCEVFIRGRCIAGRFVAGIERFYIPEEGSVELDRRVRGKEAALLLSVNQNGKAVIKDLLFNGKSWRSQVTP